MKHQPRGRGDVRRGGGELNLDGVEGVVRGGIGEINRVGCVLM